MWPSSAFLLTLCNLSATQNVLNSSSSNSPFTQQPSLEPVPFFDLPDTFGNAGNGANTSEVEAIRNTLALYPLAIDGKNFAALERVFASNAVANYSDPIGVLTSLSTIQSVLQEGVAAFTTQHSYGTQLIEVTSLTSAKSLTYIIATHFGKNAHAGKAFTAYGQYQDTWVKQSGGKWRISRRNLVYMGPLTGDTSIMETKE
ncbi:hypothetical protein BBO_06640 [Beauveria brongniartii RCEF 3172]|uniref:SnoaL-like domain-containing protein n=1 Tax=Beauveria brongniartii RCEF 3172 TaxID=1081107 RepID=A0A169YFC1_9HYPO|nr:hypothetical protein BBO_06640 [Beauveria brongniartii RCEF 3172]